MAKDVLVNAGIGEVRVAVLDGGVLDQLWLERTIGLDDGMKRQGSGNGARRNLVGDIFLGRVQRVIPAMQAAFINVGLERAGFLAAREARPRTALFRDDPYTDEDRKLQIADYVREGNEIVVQVVKDPIGDKGAWLSANITIAGRLLILVANSPGVALSRRIEDEAERARLATIIEKILADNPGEVTRGMGFIVRTAAIGVGDSELKDDALRLAHVWRTISEKRVWAAPPAALHTDLGPIERALRDEVDGTINRIVIDDRTAFGVAREYAKRSMPAMEGLIELYEGNEPLFEHFGIEDEIEGLSGPRVALPSGGWITIEATEALTAIDVNSGSYIEGVSLEETSLKVDLEAAEAIGRQLRLRGIGGLIVIDFIHLSDPANIERLLDALRVAAAKGRVPSQILGMSEFGLVEMTRKRVRDPLAIRTTEDCRRCDGHGRRKTTETVALEILRRMERAAAAAPGRPLTVRAAPGVLRWLEARVPEIREGLAKRGAAQLRFEATAEGRREIFEVSTDG